MDGEASCTICGEKRPCAGTRRPNGTLRAPHDRDAAAVLRVEVDGVTLRRLDLKPGQALAAHVPGNLTAEQADRVSQALREWLDAAGLDNPVLVVPDDLTLEVVEAADDRG